MKQEFSKVVRTGSGLVGGYEREGVMEYLGIPYAKPPVRNLRLKRAVPNHWDGVFDAKACGEPSVQTERGKAIGSEDCLTLNIRTPVYGEKLPVLVYVHGGGFNTGSVSMPLYDGKAFARKGIVYVAIQYRLNVWGFYDFAAYPEGSGFDSNCGVSDQLLAMRWIHENIGAFGGDPGRVTVAGESAGANAVLDLIGAPRAKGTFQQVILSSAIPNAYFTHEQSRRITNLFLEGMGWEEADIPKLKTVDPYDVLEGNAYASDRNQYRNPGFFTQSPILDDLIPVHPMEVVKEGGAAGIRMMISTNLHEGTMFVQKDRTVFPNTWEMIEEMFRQNGQEAGFQKIKEHYRIRNGETVNGVGMDLIDFATDYAFQIPAMKLAKAQGQYADVWMYRFDFASDFMTEIGLLAGHAMELPYEFDKKDFGLMAEEMKHPQADIVERLTDEMHMAWVEFVKYGDPLDGQWPPYAGRDGTGMVRIYDKATTIQKLDRSEILKLWDGLQFYQA